MVDKLLAIVGCVIASGVSLFLVTALTVIGGQQFPGIGILAFHAAALLVAIELVIANRTEMAIVVAPAPAFLIIGFFVAYHTGRELLTKP